MAYTIYNNDGTVLSTIAVGDVDTFSTSLDLIGKNVNNYGEYYNTNLVKLLTSFASPATEEPRSPQTGQLWFNRTSKRLTVYDGTSFQPTYGSHVSGTAPITTSTGDFWYDTVNSQLKVWDGDSYNLVGPLTSGLLGTFGILPPPAPIRDGSLPNPVKVSLINSYGKYAGLVSEESFYMTESSSTVYLAGTPYEGQPRSIVKGVTLLQDLEVLGSVYIKGEKVQTPIMLSAFFDITPYGTYTATMTTSSFSLTNTNLTAYNAANYAIANNLAKMYDPESTVASTKASVICIYNTETSVRQFILTQIYPQQNIYWWEPLNNHPYVFTATSTSTVGQVTWLWTNTIYTNIVQPAWNEIVRTDNTSSQTNTDLNTVTVGIPFYIKITGGVPNTAFTYEAATPTVSGIPAGSGILNGYGDYTSSATIVTLLDQPALTTITNYAVNLTFAATNHSRQLRFTAVQP